MLIISEHFSPDLKILLLASNHHLFITLRNNAILHVNIGLPEIQLSFLHLSSFSCSVYLSGFLGKAYNLET